MNYGEESGMENNDPLRCASVAPTLSAKNGEKDGAPGRFPMLVLRDFSIMA
jgi:hypothetical protein